MTMTLDDLSLLLVEPSQAQQMIIREQLQSLGIRQVATTETVEGALAHLRTFAPQVVLSAMHLPDGKGSELLMQMREDEELSEMAFLLVSSETRTRELEPVRQGGAVAIIPKPCSEGDLMRALGDTLDLLTREVLDLEDEDVEDMRALVVDDSRAARRFICKVLEQLGIEHLTEAEDGQQASEILAERFFDVVVTDYNMPRMNGHELVEFIRKESSQPTVPVLMVTSEKNGARVAGVERAGVSAIVDKPFEIEEVRTIMKTLLG